MEKTREQFRKLSPQQRRHYMNERERALFGGRLAEASPAPRKRSEAELALIEKREGAAVAAALRAEQERRT